MTTKKIELLAPAGNFEKLEIAIHYGADAVYLGGKDFSLRNFSGNFSLEEMKTAVDFAHANNVKVYVTCNIYSRNNEQQAIADYLVALKAVNPDAVIVADPGILSLCRQLLPQIDIHISTQANTTNYQTALFWKNAGAKRVNTARELPLSEIREIVDKADIEVEAFIHGAMCISYSGRCLLSSFMANRDSNRGQCSHPCRWKYYVLEDLRPGEYHPVYEDDRGSYIFNSKDLCMISHIPELVDSGISSLKIEGRMKGINYLASSVKVYREAIDNYLDCPETYTVKDEWLEEFSRINNRQYCTGFYFGHPDATSPNYFDKRPDTIHKFVGKVIGKTDDGVRVAVRNKIATGDTLEILVKKGSPVKDKVQRIIGRKGEQDVAQPNTEVELVLSRQYDIHDLLRSDQDSSYHGRKV